MNFNILIVDDERVMIETLKIVVKKFFKQEYPFLNLNISVAENGKEALEIEQKSAQDIILTDISMPIMDGFEFIKNVRMFDKAVPILVLSGLDDNDNIDKIMQSGATNYTSKPLNKKLFLAQIKVFVDFYLHRQNKYNRKAINLFSKNIYKRKTEFLIEKEEDLLEFWEFIIEIITSEHKAETILHFIYDTEILMIAKGISNNIVLEEDLENFYLTLLEIDKLDDKIVLDILKKGKIKETEYKTNNFFLSLIIPKTKEEVKQTIDAKKTKNIQKKIDKKEKEEVIHDIRYTIHEDISPEEFLEELDPTYEDKIEDFFEDLSIVGTHIFNLKNASFDEAKALIDNIIYNLENFNIIVVNMGLFNVISRSFGHLITFLNNMDDEILKNTQKRVLLSEMLQGLANDLESWITALFIERTADDIHYFDASFSENCFVVESTFMQTEEDAAEEDAAEEDDGLEFF